MNSNKQELEVHSKGSEVMEVLKVSMINSEVAHKEVSSKTHSETYSRSSKRCSLEAEVEQEEAAAEVKLSKKEGIFK